MVYLIILGFFLIGCLWLVMTDFRHKDFEGRFDRIEQIRKQTGYKEEK